MAKITSKLLTLFLAFAMVFTTFGFVGGYEVEAAQGDTLLKVKLVDDDGPVEGVELKAKYVGEQSGTGFTFDNPSGADGIVEFDYEEEGSLLWADDEYPNEHYEIEIDGESEYSFDTVSVVFKEISGVLYVDTVGGEAYSQLQPYEIQMTKSGGADPMADWTEKFDFNTDTTYDWTAYGIDYTTIDFDKDLIVDVRNTTNKDVTSPKYIDLNKDPHFVFSNPDAVDVTHAEIVAEDDVAKKLDAAYEKAEAAGKRVVLICYGGMKFAKRAMQYYNTQGKSLGSDGKVTYLIGGANGVLEGDYKANLGIGFADITSSDVILDVRSKENFDKGHLLGAVHVDVTDEGGKLSDKDKSDMASALAKVPSGARLVIVCNSGNSLAYRAMAYFMADKSAEGLENLKKVSYLIGGDKVIPADKKVTTEEENKPTPPTPPTTTTPADGAQNGQIVTVGGSDYKVLSAEKATVAFAKAANKKSVTVPATIKVNGKTFKVTKISANAFKGSKASKMIVKTKSLKKASVKGSLKGSKIKTVQVKVGNKKTNKKFVNSYKKIFTKKNAGRKVKVK